MKRNPVATIEPLERRIFVIRGQRVMLDRDLAEVYGVPTKRLNEQVKRNRDRFPSDFVFQLTRSEVEACNRSQSATGSGNLPGPERAQGEAQSLRSQSATSKKGRGGIRRLPYAFTEHGAVMAANVLQSPAAVSASILVVRAFIRLREMLASNAELALKLAELERRMVGHDRQFAVVFDAIRKLMEPPPGSERKRPMGF